MNSSCIRNLRCLLRRSNRHRELILMSARNVKSGTSRSRKLRWTIAFVAVGWAVNRLDQLVGPDRHQYFRVPAKSPIKLDVGQHFNRNTGCRSFENLISFCSSRPNAGLERNLVPTIRLSRIEDAQQPSAGEEAAAMLNIRASSAWAKLL
jgi:hypothetical protein